MQRRIWLHKAVIVVSVIGSVIGIAGVGLAADDPLDRRTSRISPNAVNCGSTSEGAENRDSVNACVREHFLKHRAFRARFAGRCEDSECAMAVVLESPPGGVYVVHFDSEGCKPMNSADPFCGTSVEPCREPVLVPKGKGLKLLCKNTYEL